MKYAISTGLSIFLSFAIMAQIPFTTNNGNFGIAKDTDKKFYIIDGKITDVAPKKSNQKAGKSLIYLDYYEVELDGYGLGDPNQVPRFYEVLDDSNFTYVGTAFTHVFDYTTFDFDHFGTICGQNCDSIYVDSVIFNLGHVNHSGLNNTLAITLRELPVSNLPATNGQVIWTDTVMSTSFSSGLPINLLPRFSVPVGIALPYNNRGIFLEIYFDGVTGLDSASFLFDFWESKVLCPITQMLRIDESFTYRDHSLVDGLTYFRNPARAVNLGMPASTYFSNFSLYNDCNSNGIFDHGMGEAYWVQNISQGIWYAFYRSVGIEVFEESSVKVYPNPVDEVLNIEFSRLTNDIVTLQIVDFQGRIVKDNKIKIENEFVQLDVSCLNDGIYMLKINLGAHSISKKLVIE